MPLNGEKLGGRSLGLGQAGVLFGLFCAIGFVSRSIKPIKAFALYPTHVVVHIWPQHTGVGNPDPRVVPSAKNIEVSDETMENQLRACRDYVLNFLVRQIDIIFAVQLSRVSSGRRDHDTFHHQGYFATLERLRKTPTL